MATLEQEFHARMLQIYSTAEAECRYRPTYLRQMVDEFGGLQAAKRLVRAKQQSEGFTKLWELGRLDLSVEAVILEEKWRSLFDAEDLDIARKRLRSVAYKPL